MTTQYLKPKVKHYKNSILFLNDKLHNTSLKLYDVFFKFLEKINLFCKERINNNRSEKFKIDNVSKSKNNVLDNECKELTETEKKPVYKTLEYNLTENNF